MEAFVCPICSRALTISTIEPHPTRDGVDVVTYRCAIHGDMWRSVVANQVETEQEQFIWSRVKRAAVYLLRGLLTFSLSPRTHRHGDD